MEAQREGERRALRDEMARVGGMLEAERRRAEEAVTQVLADKAAVEQELDE